MTSRHKIGGACETCGEYGKRAERRFCSRICAGAARRVEWSRAEVLRRVDIDGDGCWLWRGRINRAGYGTVQHERATKSAYRFVFELLVRAVPDGLVLDHVCHTRDLSCPGGDTCKHRRCVNPDHLEVVTQLENSRRGRGATRTHCPKGHEMAGWNLYVTPQGGRRCRECRNNKQRAYRARLVERAA